MSRGMMWIGAVLLTAGLCGLIDAAGLAPWSQTAGQWWPLAVIGWPVGEMVAERRPSLEGLIWAGVGLALLSNAQHWSSEAVAWSAFAALAGVAVLTDALARASSAAEGSSKVRAGQVSERDLS